MNFTKITPEYINTSLVKAYTNDTITTNDVLLRLREIHSDAAATIQNDRLAFLTAKQEHQRQLLGLATKIIQTGERNAIKAAIHAGQVLSDFAETVPDKLLKNTFERLSTQLDLSTLGSHTHVRSLIAGAKATHLHCEPFLASLNVTSFLLLADLKHDRGLAHRAAQAVYEAIRAGNEDRQTTIAEVKAVIEATKDELNITRRIRRTKKEMAAERRAKYPTLNRLAAEGTSSIVGDGTHGTHILPTITMNEICQTLLGLAGHIKRNDPTAQLVLAEFLDIPAVDKEVRRLKQ